MKVRFIDDTSCHEAVITRGFWRWRRWAHVRRAGTWHFVGDDNTRLQDVSSALDSELDHRMRREEKRRREAARESGWRSGRPPKLPAAHTLNGGNT